MINFINDAFSMIVELTTPESIVYLFEVDNLTLAVTTNCPDGIEMFAGIYIDVK